MKYRDDVFRYVLEKLISRGLTDTGLAFRIMEDAGCGRYAGDKIPSHIRAGLDSVGAEEWFLKSISRIDYLFSKAQGAAECGQAAALMWCKQHYPKEFDDIMF